MTHRGIAKKDVLVRTTAAVIVVAWLLALVPISAANPAAVALTNNGDATFGAESNPTGNPIGGGAGYNAIIDPAQADFVVTTKSELLSALVEVQAKTRKIVYVADAAQINLTGEHNIAIPTGVTLASGRGRYGSLGGLIYSTAQDTKPLFLAAGQAVRLTGLRLQGPDPDRHGSPYELPISDGIESEFSDLEIDNSELSGWSQCAVCIWGGTGNYIHHNYIHHNQRSGLGYGIELNGSGNVAEALIEGNLFDWNRHNVAGRGWAGDSYEARYNVVLENANGHSFDMHGGGDRGDGTNIAGSTITIHHNTVHVLDQSAALIGGIPTVGVWVYDNWFLRTYSSQVVGQYYAYGHMYVYSNAYGPYPIPPEVKDLRGYWPLDEGSGTTVHDASGLGNDGTLTNMNPGTNWIAGVAGQALQFSGGNGYVDFGSRPSLVLTDPMVLDLWVKLGSTTPNVNLVNNDLYRLFYRGEWAGNRLYFLYRIAEGVYSGDSGWQHWAGVRTATELVIGQWYHIVGVKSGDRMALYVNDLEEADLNCLAGYTVDDSQVSHLLVGQGFTGALDEIEIGRYQPGFLLLGAPAFQSIPPGGSAQFGVYFLRNPSDPQPAVTVAAGTSPAGLSAALNPAVLNTWQTAALTVNDTSGASPVWYTVTLTGSDGGYVNTASVRVLVGGTRIYLPLISKP